MNKISRCERILGILESLPPPMQGLMVKWYCHTVRMQTAKYKRFHSSAVCSTATAESGKQRNYAQSPFQRTRWRRSAAGQRLS